jgi:hypothetical protein
MLNIFRRPSFVGLQHQWLWINVFRLALWDELTIKFESQIVLGKDFVIDLLFGGSKGRCPSG